MGTPPRAPGPLPGPWSTALESWRIALDRAGRTTPATLEGYAKHIGWLAFDLGRVTPDPWDLTPALLTGWLDAQNWSASTRRKVLVSIRGFYTWAVVEGHCQRSPLAGVAAVPPRKRGPGALEFPVAWRAPVEQWTTWLEAAATRPASLEQRRWWIRRLAETYGNPWNVTTDDLAAFLSREDWAPETKRVGRSSLRTFYAWAEQADLVTRSPARDLPTVRTPRSVPRPTPDDALALALDRADDRIRLALALASFAGLRRAEIAALHTSDLGTDTIRVTGKGGHQRLVPMHPELRHLLSLELRCRRAGIVGTGWPTPPAADGFLFPSDRPGQPMTAAHLGKLIARALPERWTAHSLRHRFATQAYAVERDLRAVQELLGHASPTTTIRYAQVPSNALRNAVHGVTRAT